MNASHNNIDSISSRNILVTGSHRSGTTWVGKTLAASGGIDYVHEPLNLLNARDYNSPVSKWYEYIGKDEKRKEQFTAYLKSVIDGGSSTCIDRIKRSKVKKTPSIIYSELRKFIRRNKPKVVKDPLALYSAEFFHNSLDYDVIITIRHPAAFAESLKNINWTHDFNHFLSQDELMKEVMPDYQEEIERFVRSKKKREDILEQAILLWNLTHARILYYMQNYENWIFVKNEALSLNPHKEYEKIFKYYQLPFNDQVKSFIDKTTGGSETAGEKRDSRRNVTKWTRKLSGKEIDQIHLKTAKIAKYFYDESEWFSTTR